MSDYKYKPVGKDRGRPNLAQEAYGSQNSGKGKKRAAAVILLALLGAGTALNWDKVEPYLGKVASTDLSVEDPKAAEPTQASATDSPRQRAAKQASTWKIVDPSTIKASPKATPAAATAAPKEMGLPKARHQNALGFNHMLDAVLHHHADDKTWLQKYDDHNAQIAQSDLDSGDVIVTYFGKNGHHKLETHLNGDSQVWKLFKGNRLEAWSDMGTFTATHGPQTVSERLLTTGVNIRRECNPGQATPEDQPSGALRNVNFRKWYNAASRTSANDVSAKLGFRTAAELAYYTARQQETSDIKARVNLAAHMNAVDNIEHHVRSTRTSEPQLHFTYGENNAWSFVTQTYINPETNKVETDAVVLREGKPMFVGSTKFKEYHGVRDLRPGTPSVAKYCAMKGGRYDEKLNDHTQRREFSKYQQRFN